MFFSRLTPSVGWPSISSSLLAAILLLSTRVAVGVSAGIISNNCTCFITNGSTAAYYANHRFLDYRNIGSSLDSDLAPPLLTSPDDTTNANITSDYFASSEWTDMWSMQTWNNSAVLEASNASILMINTQNNVFIEASSANDIKDDPMHKTHLTLRTARDSSFQSVAEIDSNEANFHYMSARFLARVTGSPGACAGLFTYLGPSDNTNDPKRQVQESDIEILTSGPNNVVQYTNQPSVDAKTGNVLSQATVNATLPAGIDWINWNVYRVDWTPQTTSWYVNGVSVANISFQTPKDPSALIVNMWSDGGEWTGKMPLGGEALLQLQWVDMVFNTSGAYSGIQGGQGSKRSLWGRGDGCQAVCSIDQGVNSSSVGKPQLAQFSDAKHSVRKVASWIVILGFVVGSVMIF